VLKHLWEDLSRPHAQLCSFVLRIGLGTIFVWHGVLKLALDYGSRWSATLPEGTQLVVAWGETICGVALLAGLLSRLAALGVVVIMVGAIMVQTANFGFVPIEAPPVGTTRYIPPVGSEYNFALIVIALGVIALGSDPLSLDHLLFGRRKRPQPTPAGEQVTAAPVERPRVSEAAGLPGEG
jgi:putative oxidoreductase